MPKIKTASLLISKNVYHPMISGMIFLSFLRKNAHVGVGIAKNNII
jgi:hypothetical protein